MVGMVVVFGEEKKGGKINLALRRVQLNIEAHELGWVREIENITQGAILYLNQCIIQAFLTKQSSSSALWARQNL